MGRPDPRRGDMSRQDNRCRAVVHNAIAIEIAHDEQGIPWRDQVWPNAIRTQHLPLSVSRHPVIEYGRHHARTVVRGSPTRELNSAPMPHLAPIKVKAGYSTCRKGSR